MIPLPLQPKIAKSEKNLAIFEIEALYPGYGVTLANAMRRVLLSSLKGAAVTQVKIKGVSHEFSTISGVQEDVITLMLNLKNLRFKVFSDEPQKGILKIKGEKDAKGADLDLPSQVELANPDCHIATLTSKTSDLEMELTIEKGVGYSPREGRKKEKLEIGTIPLDAIFTPVKKVSFKLENMRVGDRTDFDKLFLEIETDGTVSPETAFAQAAKILVEHFSLLGETFPEEEMAPKAEGSLSEKKEKKTSGKKSKPQAKKKKK
jgi:DNA-directed RNA polymerase subunit alpha